MNYRSRKSNNAIDSWKQWRTDFQKSIMPLGLILDNVCTVFAELPSTAWGDNKTANRAIASNSVLTSHILNLVWGNTESLKTSHRRGNGLNKLTSATLALKKKSYRLIPPSAQSILCDNPFKLSYRTQNLLFICFPLCTCTYRMSDILVNIQYFESGRLIFIIELIKWINISSMCGNMFVN